MNLKARGVVAWAASLIMLALMLGSSAAPSLAQTPAKSIKDQLVGHWRLVSVTINDAAPYGTSPQGSMFLDADGHYAIIVLSGGNAKDISYFGTYTADDSAGVITLHIDGSSHANADGRDQKRLVTFSGDEVIVATSPSARRGSIKLTWKRS
jgi:hypothetical protein